MSVDAERTPDGDGPPSVGIAEMADGDVVFFDKDNPAGFIRTDPEAVVDLGEDWSR